MKNILNSVLADIELEYSNKIGKGARNYLEVNLAEQAKKFGYDDIGDKFKDVSAIIPLKQPEKGMKVRIDGRTFVNYAEYESGVAIPGYLAKESGRPYQTFIPNDSMICNFC